MLEAPAQSLAHTLLWGAARVFSILALVVAWEGLWRAAAQLTPFMLPSLSSVARAHLARCRVRATCLSTPASRSIAPWSAS